jgi:hypothetical protein
MFGEMEDFLKLSCIIAAKGGKYYESAQAISPESEVQIMTVSDSAPPALRISNNYPKVR